MATAAQLKGRHACKIAARGLTRDLARSLVRAGANVPHRILSNIEPMVLSLRWPRARAAAHSPLGRGHRDCPSDRIVRVGRVHLTLAACKKISQRC